MTKPNELAIDRRRNAHTRNEQRFMDDMSIPAADQDLLDIDYLKDVYAEKWEMFAP